MDYFMSSYADAVQSLPGELQTHITAYLQSDLQHQNLLSLCKRYMDSIRQTRNTESQKHLMQKLIVSLLAIQDICNRRIVTLSEVGFGVLTPCSKLQISGSYFHLSLLFRLRLDLY